MTVETFLYFHSKVLQWLCVFPDTEPDLCGSAQGVQMEIIRSLIVFVTLLFQFSFGSSLSITVNK